MQATNPNIKVVNVCRRPHLARPGLVGPTLEGNPEPTGVSTSRGLDGPTLEETSGAYARDLESDACDGSANTGAFTSRGQVDPTLENASEHPMPARATYGPTLANAQGHTGEISEH